MFKLKNEFGNVIRIVETERERDRLISRGYTLYHEKKTNATEKITSKTRGASNVKK